jgi:hypothetical protein
LADPALVTATELTSWADRRDAQESLPKLVRRLILATCDRVARISFPSGEGIQKPGWDGVVVAQPGNAFVPDGFSVWELGVNRDSKAKADEDYEKRTGDPLDANPSESTVIFVTPRRWFGKEQWAAAKRAEGIWREVRVYDADDLEVWLGQAPVVHTWITDQVTGGVGAAQSLEDYWENWSVETEPRFSPDLVMGGRDREAREIVQRLAGPPSAFGLRADSQDEAVAYAASCIQQLAEPDRNLWHSRALVCGDRDAWRWAVAAKSSLLLIPLFDGAQVGAAVRAGHHVLVPLGRDGLSAANTIELPRLRRAAAQDALLGMGLPRDNAEILATLARRSLLSARRRLSLNPGTQEPPWARPDEAPSLLPLVLAGTWDENYEGDRGILAALAESSYDELQRVLARWANTSDPPIRRVGTVWVLVSKEDAWNLLARFLTSSDIKRFEDTISRVLGAVNPALDLPPDERPLAALRGRGAAYSDLLREGLADTLAIMGARSAAGALATGNTSQAHADLLVRRLLASANTDQMGRLWSSLEDVLPLLAEAAPEAFLEAAETGLSGATPVLGKLFTDGDGLAAPFLSSPHTGLLWALENLAWSADYLGRVSLLLARLARLDPGGKLGNRPDRSLLTIYRLWYPQTAAPLDQRLRILDTLSEREPTIAWRLLAALVPKHHDVTDMIHTPRWREWKPDVEAGPTTSELGHAIEHVVAQLVAVADADRDRWKDLVEILDRISVPHREMVIDRLLDMDLTSLSQDGRAAVWHAVRKMVSRHRRLPEADWAMPREQVDRLADVYSRFTPADLTERYSWLFADAPALAEVEGEDWERYRRAVDDARLAALRDIHTAGGFAAILRLAAAARYPGLVGQVLGISGLIEEDESPLFTVLDSPDESVRLMARGYVVGRFSVVGWDWANAVLAGVASWSPDQRAEFLSGLPAAGPTWDWAAQFGGDTEHGYWTRALPFGLEEPRDSSRAAAKLIEHGRADAAVELLALYTIDSSQQPEPELVLHALEHLLGLLSGERPAPTVQGHSIARLFDLLARAPAVDTARLARLEWAYLPLLDGGRRPPRLLHRELSRDAAFFADVIAQTFRGEGDEPREPTADEASRARRSHRLLFSWRSVPGLQEHGSLDEATLNTWVDEARSRLGASGRAEIGDELIGHVLCYVPPDEDGTWPHRAVRDLLERAASQHMELGLEVEVRNSRGFTSRGLTDGGDQERELVERYSSYAKAVQDRWPRTAAMLRQIALSYSDEADRHDRAAELREDLWR